MAFKKVTHRKKVTGYTEVSFHGIPYAEFDKSGHWNARSILRLIEASHHLAVTRTTNIELDRENQYIIVRQRCVLNRKLHDHAKLDKEFSPKVRMKFREIGASSITSEGELQDERSQQVYITYLLKNVHVNRKTMKSVPNRQYFQNLAFDVNVESKYVWPKFPLHRPSHVYRMKVIPLYSDMDYMYHVNNVAYIRFCVDCATSAAKSGFYRNFAMDLYQYPVEDIDIQYLGESLANDTLTVISWQSENDLHDIYFEIEKANIVITKVYMRFGSQNSHPLIHSNL